MAVSSSLDLWWCRVWILGGNGLVVILAVIVVSGRSSTYTSNMQGKMMM